jgi:hypothetical protein
VTVPDVEPLAPASTTGDAPSHPTTAAGRSRWGARFEFLAMSAVGGAILTVICEYFPSVTRGSLSLGTGDHVVLAPLGIHWADPQAFAGDWFMTNAPQPHWLFDYLIKFGWQSGHLSLVLFAYWVLGCFVTGMATAVLARPWGREHAWGAVIACGLLSGIIPFAVAGSTWMGYPSAVPNMLGGALLYLLSACVIAGRYRWTLVILPVLAVVHVQIGAIALAVSLLGAIACVPLLRKVQPPRGRVGLYAGVWVLSAVIVLAEMKARSVAADRKDFVEICDKYIPYHCSASQWPAAAVVAVLACCALTLACAVYVRPVRRPIFLGTVGVCAVGTVVAMVLDGLHVPVLGELMQALNGYRVGLAMYPYAMWGLVLPFLRPAFTLKRRLAVAVVCVAMPLFHSAGTGKIDFGQGKFRYSVTDLALIAAYVVLAVVAAGGLHRTHEQRRRFNGAVLAAFCVWVLVAAFGTAMYFQRHPSATVWGGKAGAAWGVQARKILPPGSQYLASPYSIGFRLNSQRGSVVDCKNIPYGGPAYGEWKERLDAVGGWEHCLHDTYFTTMPARELVAVADRYGADAIITKDDEGRDQVRDLTALGWSYYHVKVDTIDSAILLRPGVAPADPGVRTSSP